MAQQTGSMKHFLAPRLREAALIGATAVSLYLLLALVSYAPDDPGWSATGSGDPIRNSAGLTGAWLADVFFSLIGYLAFLFPLMLGYRAWLLFLHRHDESGIDWVTLTIRSLGFCLVMIAGAALATLNDVGHSSLPQGFGGILGQAVAAPFIDLFSSGSRLILVAVFLLGMTVFTDLSWLRLLEQVGFWTLEGGRLASDRWHAFTDWRKQRSSRQVRRKEITEHVEKEKKRKPRKIKTTLEKVEKSTREERERQQPLFDTLETHTLPALELLDEQVRDPAKGFSKNDLDKLSQSLELKLADFGISVEVVAVYPGPVITRFEIQLAAGVKVSRISNLAKDLARALAVISVRVVEIIPGKSVVGIEIPNEHREIVNFRKVLSSQAFENSKSPLTLALGHNISGQPVVADLSRMPHLLVAGTTGAGKSVGVNAMLLSMLYKSGPEDVRLILVDPKMLELSVYDGIPHLLTPVITDMKDAANGLRWCVAEMDRRYKLMSTMGVRNLAGYNRKIEEALAAGEPLKDPLWAPQPGFELIAEESEAEVLGKLPFVVVVIDEFADMMMMVGKKVEELIARIAQKARAAGIHLILATQRPSVDVITGLIKANIPTRIAFQVSSKVDSRTILDQGGAEQLLGHGDMLYLPPGTATPVRVHGAFVDDHEVHRVVKDWKRRGDTSYIEGLLDESKTGGVLPGEQTPGEEELEEDDPFYDEAVHYVTSSRRASISSVQRKFRIGYNRAARLIESMEMAGVVSAMSSNGQREVIAPPPAEE